MESILHDTHARESIIVLNELFRDTQSAIVQK